MSGASTVYVARHGERIDHVNPSWLETAKNPHDPFLTEKGVQQAAALGARLAGGSLQHIFCSPFYRTVQTAVEVSKATGVSVKVEPGLSEFLNPDWFSSKPQMRSVDELQAEFGVLDTDYCPEVRPNYPETKAELVRRAGEIARTLANKSEGEILLVAHGIVCEFTVRGLTDGGRIPYIAYCALQTVKREERGFSTDRLEPEIDFMQEDIRPVIKGWYQ